MAKDNPTPCSRCGCMKARRAPGPFICKDCTSVIARIEKIESGQKIRVRA